jgi:AcrR family transcriptional regulator
LQLYRLDGIVSILDAVPASPDPVSVRDRLLNAAERVVTRHGVSNLTLEAVDQEASVSKGGLLYHFPSKSAMITAIVERMACRCDADQAALMAQDPRTVGGFTRAYLELRIENPDPHKEPIHTTLLAAAGTNPDYLEPFRRRMVEWQAKLESDGIDPTTATIVRLAMDGLGLSRLLGLSVPEGEFLERVIDRLRSMTMPQKP